MANTTAVTCSGGVGFIGWLGPLACCMEQREEQEKADGCNEQSERTIPHTLQHLRHVASVELKRGPQPHRTATPRRCLDNGSPQPGKRTRECQHIQKYRPNCGHGPNENEISHGAFCWLPQKSNLEHQTLVPLASSIG